MQRLNLLKQSVQRWFCFHCSHKYLWISQFLQPLIQFCINTVTIMRGSMSHKYNCFLFFDSSNLCHHCLKYLVCIFRSSQQRSTNPNLFKLTASFQDSFFQLIIFNSSDHMGWLHDHIRNSI